MADRVVVFVDYQNVYRLARSTFHDHALDPHWCGQVDPVKLALHLVSDSPFDRELTQVRIYRGQP
ncbi:MAG: NYN domain-containing protein, partial [Candidatus Dormibacteria bacterium]